MKNVPTVIRGVICLFLFITIVSCGEDKKGIYLQPHKTCFDERYELPQKVPITYRGYELGKAELNKKDKFYKVEFQEREFTLLRESEFLMMPSDIMMTSFEIKIDTVDTGHKYSEAENATRDTIILHCTDSIVVSKEIDAVMKGLKQIADTLR
ncbi:MAG: hypothetical protein RLP14_08090 [Owenweeksia sp.]